MADNTSLSSGSGGDVIATDDVAGVKFQRIKLIHGADGVNDGDVSAANPLPVTVSSTTLAGSTTVTIDYDTGVGSVPLALIGLALPASGGPVAGGTGTNPFSVRAVQSTASDLLATVTPVAGSTWATRPLQSSAADLQMTATPAAGSTWNVRPLQSSQADLRMTAYQSSAADFNVTVAGYVAPSTIVTISTGSVRVHQSTASDLQMTATPLAGSTWNVRPLQSSAADLQMTGRVNTSSGGAVEGSTTSPTPGVLGLHIRPVLGTLLSTTALITSTASTAIYALVSSAAGVRHKVFAYAVMSTHTRPSTFVFASSNASDKWALMLGSGSSGITGANLAASPPSWIFHTEVGEALTVRFEDNSSAASTQIARVSISYFTEA